jgi:hypothetical protein
MIFSHSSEWRVVSVWTRYFVNGMLQVGSRLLEDALLTCPPGAPRVYMREQTVVISLWSSTYQFTRRSSAAPPV